MVKPTAAIASTAAVTRPKPSEARNRLIVRSRYETARSCAAVMLPVTWTAPEVL